MKKDARKKHLKEAVRQDMLILPALPKRFEPKASQKALAKVQHTFQDIEEKSPTDFNPEETYDAIDREFSARGHLRELDKSLRRRAPWVFFMSFPDKPPLGGDAKKAQALIDLYHTWRRPRLVASLLRRYLLNYPDDWETHELLRKGIKKLLGHKSQRLQGWRDRNERFHFVEPRGPEKFAAAALATNTPLADVLAEAHLTDELETGRFVEKGYLAMIREMRRALESTHPSPTRYPEPSRTASQQAAGELALSLRRVSTLRLVDRVLAYSEAQNELRFSSQRGELANALLEPFSEGDPDPGTRTRIEEFLRRFYGHPGLEPSKWVGASEQARAVFLRWLVRSTLDDFFHVLDRTAQKGSQEEYRWQYRKAFWGAYHRRGFIRDAWVAAGSRARDLLRRHRRTGMFHYADLSGAAPSDCLLLLKIGSMTIAEVSHTGSCRCWLQGNRTAPSLYQPHYMVDQIRYTKPDESFRHHGAQSYSWQYQISSYIRRVTKASVTPKEYILQ